MAQVRLDDYAHWGLLELPVTMAENLILVRASALTEEQAMRILSDVGKRAAAGAAGTAVFTGIAMVGLPVKAVAMPLAVPALPTWARSTRWLASS